jgi:hypothetical protein
VSDAGATKKKAWAVLAYTVADDKGKDAALDRSAERELKAVYDAADFSQISIAAQVDFKKAERGVYRAVLTAAPAESDGFKDIRIDETPLWREIKKTLERSVLHVQHERSDLNAADAGVLSEFLKVGCTECPAERYAVFFYGHAYGPMGLFYDSASAKRDANTLRLNDLAKSIAHVTNRADIVVFRDCFMNTLETACQLHGKADYMIATQTVAPIAGVWPWLNFMSALMPGASSAAVAESLVMQLAHFLDVEKNRHPFADVPYSLLDLSKADAVTKPLKALTDALDAARAEPKRATACGRAIDASRIGAPSTPHDPGDPALLDVLTLCSGLQALEGDPVAGPARALGEVVQKKLVMKHYSRTGKHHGVSLYCKPTKARHLELSFIQAGDPDGVAKDAEYYKKLALSEATGWHRIALNPLKA